MYIKVRVKTKAKKEEVLQKSEDHFIISVKQKPERNMANRRVCELIAEHFHLDSSQVRIINGHQSPSKMLAVELE